MKQHAEQTNGRHCRFQEWIWIQHHMNNQASAAEAWAVWQRQESQCQDKQKIRHSATNETDLLAEWKEYFMSSLLSATVNHLWLCPLLLPRTYQPWPIPPTPWTREEVLSAINQMKTNKAAGLDCAITAEAHHNGGDVMVKIVHNFCAEVYTSLMSPNQWTTNVFVPQPKKGGISQMTNYCGISLLSIIEKVYNKISFNRIRNHVDSILRENQAEFRSGRSWAHTCRSSSSEGSRKVFKITNSH